MTKDEARKLLEKNRNKMRQQKSLNEQAEAEMNKYYHSSLISGPETTLEYPRIKKNKTNSNSKKQ